ncbi:hypothetical protein AJ80_03971 [Polytolypa hystricis UAMH7299]|uniref:Uncharacterized protein n=1 Tax=Polytolypa hystricis (strain UAMH7299) TaxID=1447883 RepID=A0A2B7YE56_POLH7|nr:hypothetical protein AJ80_03971 [Polytolypa hystricis UAMH7299]
MAKFVSKYSCDVLFDICQRAVNEEEDESSTVQDCEQERDACRSAQSAAQVQAFDGEAEGPPPEQERIALDDEFDLLCDL